jgi:hypothetical protein
LLVRDVVDRYQGRVAYKVENWGESALAARMGIARYPIVFVNEAVFAAPRDMGFYGTNESAGRYTPWRDPANHARFRDDLVKLLDRVLAGEALPQAGKPAAEATLAKLPPFTLAGLDGKSVSAAGPRGETRDRRVLGHLVRPLPHDAPPSWGSWRRSTRTCAWWRWRWSRRRRTCGRRRRPFPPP